MSNVIPSVNKGHSLGKGNPEIIRWNELWVGFIDVDGNIAARIPNLDLNDLNNVKYDSIQVRGHITLNQGDYFLKDFVNNNLLLNLAEELKNIQTQINSVNQTNSSNYIQQINSIDTRLNPPSPQYNPINKILTLYTDDINELQNDPGTPHLWWTQDRFDYSFSNKSINDLSDINTLLKMSDLNYGDGISQGLIPAIDPWTRKIKETLLPPDIVNNNNLSNNKTLIVGTLLERDAYLNPFEGLFWKILDNSQPELNDLLYIYNGSSWLEIVGQTINQNDIITQINLNTNLIIDINKNLTGLDTSKIAEYQNINYSSASNIFFSRERLFNSLESPDNSILITQTPQTNIINLSIVGYNPINSIEQVYNSLLFSFVPTQSTVLYGTSGATSVPTNLYKSFNFKDPTTLVGASKLNSLKGILFSGNTHKFPSRFLKDFFLIDSNYFQIGIRQLNQAIITEWIKINYTQDLIDDVTNIIISDLFDANDPFNILYF